MKSTVRGPVVALALIVLLASAIGLLAPRTGPQEPASPPAPAAPPTPQAPGRPADPADAERTAEDALLRERLGSLAALVLTDDPLVERCATRAATAPVPGGGRRDEVVAAAEALRGLTLDDPVDVDLVDAETMAAEVEERFARRGDPERVDVERLALVALGAITEDTDLAALRLEAFAEQVSGLHAANEGRVLLRVDDPARLSPLERAVLAHEIEHAATFQRLGRPRGHPEERADADARLASAAVVEGSATLVMLQYARAVLDDDERAALRDELVERAQAHALAGYTPYLRDELRFPYTAGLRYVCARWLEGGWEAVDAAYADPPDSTAAVLDPAREGQSRDPAPLGTLEEPWERAAQRAFGAAELEWLLAAPGGDRDRALDEPGARALAWAGGRLEVWTRGEASAVGLALVGGGHARRPPLCATLDAWYGVAFPDATRLADGGAVTFAGAEQHAVLVCDGDEVRLGIAPDAEQARRLSRP